MAGKLRVGVIGVSSARGWASIAHVPALRATHGVEFSGVTGKTQESADSLAARFGAARGYASVESMIADPAIDVVTVAVRVPSHRDLALKAFGFGKHVYCEWPLGRTVQEAEELRNAAAQAGVHVAIGLQSRANPALLKAQALLRDGAIGRILSARMYSGTIAFGPTEEEADSYLEDPTNGATHLTIHGGHALDAAIALLGALARVSSLNTVQYPQISIDHGARTLRRTIADHLLIAGETEAGAALIIEVDGGRPKDQATFRFELTGERGSLALHGRAPVGFQAGRLALTVDDEPVSVLEDNPAALPDAAVNIAAAYAMLRDDIANNTRTAPDFSHAVRLTKLLNDIDLAAYTVTQAQVADWPAS